MGALVMPCYKVATLLGGLGRGEGDGDVELHDLRAPLGYHFMRSISSALASENTIRNGNHMLQIYPPHKHGALRHTRKVASHTCVEYVGAARGVWVRSEGVVCSRAE